MADNIHAATLIRLQVTITALQEAAHALDLVSTDGPESAKIARSEGLTALADDLDAEAVKARDALKLVRAALDVALGRSTDIPAELRRHPMLADPDQTARFLSIPAQS